MVEMRGGIEVRRLRGACLETCWKQRAVAKERSEQPTSFRFQPFKGAAWEERADADVLSLVWPATERTSKDLERLGYVVCYAQSTYVRTEQAVENTPQTRSQSGFSVDLTLKAGADELWLETVWSDSGNLCASARQAGVKLDKYKRAATETKRFPKRWKLDDHLGGAFLKPPSAFGTLVVGAAGYRLKLDGQETVLRTFGVAVGASSKQKLKRNNQQEALNQKTCRQKKLRENGRRTLRGSTTRKKPAAQTR